MEDRLGREFCAGILKQDGVIDISAEELQKEFNKYFIDLTGIAPYAD